MNSDFSSFGDGIGLSKPEWSGLKARYDEAINTNALDIILDIACLAARASLGSGQVDTSPLNQTLVNENWSLTCIAVPHCIILPRDARDVSRALKIIAFFRVPFAVRSGGHSPNPGWSSVDRQGILLDLQRMNQINLSADKKAAIIGPGARWGDITTTLGAQDATVVGARNPLVGIGGLVLGGGYSHLSAEYGTIADNVKNFEIVLADGTVTNANVDENDDLFWALKGGGPNFGIVTKYELYTVPVNKIWYQIAIYSNDLAANVLDIFAQWQTNQGASDFKGHVLLGFGLDSVILGLVYSAPIERPSTFAPFYELEALQVAVPSTIGTFASLDQVLGAFTLPGHFRHDYRGASSRIDAQLYKDVYAYWLERAVAVRDATGANQTFVLQHVPSNIAAQGAAKGGNPLGIPQEAHQWWTTLVDWTDEKDDDLVRSVAIETTEEWKRLGQERGLYVPFTYMNDAARDQNPIASYGPENVDRLKRIARKYDRNQLFQKQQNGGFLLSRV